MDANFRRIAAEDMDQHLQPVLAELIGLRLQSRQPGHCMRVGNLSGPLMERLASSLATQFVDKAQVHVLVSHDHVGGDSLHITSSKLIELRNPLPNGDLRPPLLVFVPDDLRTSAEDSFAEATFEQVELADAYTLLQDRLLSNIPTTLRTHAEECLRFLRERNWSGANDGGAIRFLLSIKLNGYEEDVAGAALCELGLIPDFSLLEDASILQNRISKNLEAAKILLLSNKSEVGRVLELQISNHKVKTDLIAFLSKSNLEDPVAWTTQIACDPTMYGISFDKWGTGSPRDFSYSIHLQVTDLDLPEIGDNEEDPRLRELKGQRVLIVGQNGPPGFKVKFRCDPSPETAPAIDHFRLQIISRENGPTGAVKKKKAWTGGRQEATQSFTKVRSMDWEEGWHFVRVLPYSSDGDILPIVDSGGDPISVVGSEEGPSAPHESDLFYVVCDENIEVDVPQRAVPRFPTIQHAIIFKSLGAIQSGDTFPDNLPTRVNWQATDSGSDQLELVEFKFAGEGSVNIPLTRPLRQLEQAILSSESGATRWSLSLNHRDAPKIAEVEAPLPQLEAASRFRDARTKLFEFIRGEDGRGVVELCPISTIYDAIIDYAQSYSELVSQALRKVETEPDQQKQSLEALSNCTGIDSVTVRLTDFKGGCRTALLVAPTHPLRLLWLAAWSKLADSCREQLAKGKADQAASVRQELFETLSLINFPTSVPGTAGRILQSVDNIHPLWTLYATTDETDPRGLVAELCTATGLPEAVIGGFSLNGDFLANRVRRYIVQHPYIQTLIVNCFNAGRGKILADALLALQRFPDTKSLRYDIRIFAGHPEAPGVGEDLAELILPSSSLTVPEADPFATPTGDHLAPKLTYSIRSQLDFQENPSEFVAHISLLFDVFPAQSVGAVIPNVSEDCAPIHGLLQDFSILYEEDGDRVAWHKCPRHGRALPIPNCSEASTLLSALASMLSTASAAIATGQAGSVKRPIFTLVLGPQQKALLHQVHEVSDWVFTIDKSLGVEFFDHKPSVDRPEYLIDHSPDFSSNSGRRVVITSRSQTEIRVLFERVLVEHGLGQYVSRSASLLGELRALSGRLALKLVSASTHRAEALGLALGKLFLEYQTAFKNQAVVPLDSHIELFRPEVTSPSDLADEVSLRRTDLALFEFNPADMSLVCRLIEIKCYKDTGGSLESLVTLKSHIAEQLENSERAIRKRFNCELDPLSVRPDRVIKTQELCNLLEFYVERAHRLGLLRAEVYDEAKFFLRTMEKGFQLSFTRSALIFDFEKAGFEESLEEGGIEYHRIGVDLIERLVAALPASDQNAETLAFEPSGTSAKTVRRDIADPVAELRTQSFPLIEKAAFLPPNRTHSVSWDSLTTGQDLETNCDGKSPERIADTAKLKGVIAPSSDLKEYPVAPKGREEDAIDNAEPASLPPSDGTHFGLPVEQVGDDDEPGPKTIPPDVILGTTVESPQYGHLAKLHGRTIALDLNQTQTISLFGVQGGGKSYTLGTIIEMATMSIPGVNLLPKPLATVVFHYSQTQDYKPEFTSMNAANNDAGALESLIRDYSSKGQALDDIVLLAPEGKVAARRAEYPNITVLPLKFSSSELQAAHWRFLMGAVGNQATYIRRLNQVMRSMRDSLTLEGLRAAVQNAGFSDSLRDLAMMRLDLAQTYIDDSARISEIVRPGRLVIVDLRDEFIEKDEALGLFVVILQLFSDATYEGLFFNKLVVFDEAHKYIENPDLVDGLINVVREMRHKGTSILVASQDPPSVPVALIELSTQIILHRFNSPAWLKHIQKANASLSGIQSDQLSRLRPGEAFIWSAKATDRTFSTEAIKVHFRPRITKHGGDTKTAVG